MKLIVGLGNPGEKYINNRHNVGFMFIDYLAKSQNIQFEYDKYLRSEIARTDDLILLKPQTFMNLSGVAVKNVIKKWKLKNENLTIVHDDLDIPLGKFKIQHSTGPKVHNGLSSIELHLKTNEFIRIRIGVENRDPEKRIPGETYVLENFSQEEVAIIYNTMPAIYNRLLQENLKKIS